VWKYDISIDNWIWIGGDSTVNSNGSYATTCITNNSNISRNGWENRAVCFDSSGNVFMFGSIGSNCNGFTAVRNEFWNYNTNINEWTLIRQNSPIVWGIKGVPAPANAPPKTFGSVAWWRGNEVWVFGGSEYGNPDSYNSMWRFTIDSNCIPNSIQENDFTKKILVYPNPANTSLTVSFESLLKQTIELRLYNPLGEEIYFFREVNVTGFTKEINVQMVSRGIYFLQVRMNEKIVNKKIVRQ
jgi:type IX secretion system substrate protein